jgi:hypothetical protein
MSLSLIILDGPTPTTARPILATSDPDILAAVRQLLLQRLVDTPRGTVLPLHRPQVLSVKKAEIDGAE